MKLTKEHITQFQAIETLLRSGVHVKNCLAIFDCPRDHLDCDQQLNDNTAVAWAAATILKDCQSRKSITNESFYSKIALLKYLVGLSNTKGANELWSGLYNLSAYNLADISFDNVIFNLKDWVTIRHQQG